MFFKRRNKDNQAPASDAPEPEKKDAGSGDGSASSTPSSVSPAPKAVGLSADALRRTVDADRLGFKTTADLEPADGLIGQERALSALDFGLKMRAPDFHVFVMGPPGSGKRTAVRAQLSKTTPSSAVPSDWVYVTNFADPRRPRALKLPAGRARVLARMVSSALSELQETLPAAFRAEDYETRRRAIDEEFRGSHEDAVAAVHTKAAEQNIAVLRTPLGFGMAPMHDGKVVKPEVFRQLPEVMRRDVETRIAALNAELEAVLAKGPQADKDRRRQLAALNEETARHAIEAALDEVSQAFADLADVARFLADVERALVANVDLFLTKTSDGGTIFRTSDGRAQAGGPLGRYMVNVVVGREKDAGVPIESEDNPTVSNLLGSISPATPASGPRADALAIHPGVLHAANGGTLLLDARQILGSPGAWDALARALDGREIRIETGARDCLPEPIPLDVKVVLFGTPGDYQDLIARDPAASHLFKVQVHFNDTTARTSESESRYARLIASLISKHGLKPIGPGGVARLIEEASRIASDREKLTLELGRIADVVREADFWSRHAGRDVTTADDVKRAITERARRANGMRGPMESAGLESLLTATADAKPGQVIALGVAQAGTAVFGQPARISARVHVGRGRVAGIARPDGRIPGATGEALLRDYLAATFGPDDAPPAFAARLMSEPPLAHQGGEDAMLADLFALLLALADLPPRPGLAVTGALGPMGEVRAVRHINERIESFFDLVTQRDLPGTPGVIIADADRGHLMLRDEVAEAVRKERFAVHAIKTVDEGLALLAGREAGSRSADGSFGAETVNGRIDARLRAFAKRAQTVRADKDTSQSVTEKRA